MLSCFPGWNLLACRDPNSLACEHMKRALLILCLMHAAHAEKPVTMETRVFRTPPTFMRPSPDAPAFEYRPSPFRELPDPFAAEPATVKPNVRDTSRSYLKRAGIDFPDGSASFYDATTHQFTIHNTPEMLKFTEAYLEDLARLEPSSVSFYVQILEAPGAVLRDLEKQVTVNADCGKALASLLKRAQQPSSDLRLVTSARIEALNGHQSVYESIIEHAFCETLHFDMKNRLNVPYARRAVGAMIELDPTVGPDMRTIELNYQIGLHPGLPIRRDMAVTDPTTQEKVAFSTSDFMLAHFVSSTTFTDGMTKLVGITRPPGVAPAAGDDVVWGIFIAAKIQRTALEPKDRPQPHTLAEGLHSVRRTVRADDLEYAIHGHFFGEVELPASEKRGPIPDFLTRNGITHVEGSSFTIEEDTLLITNTLENIERIDGLLTEDFGNGSKSCRHVLHIVEAPAKLLRELSTSAHQHFDHAAEWSRVLEAVDDGSARHLEVSWVVGKPMNKIILTTGRDHAYLDGLNLTPEGKAELLIQRRLIGASLTLTPTDETQYPHSYEYRLETHTAPEELRRLEFRDPSSQKRFDLPFTDFHLARARGRTILHSGSVKLLSIWKPAGRPELEKKDLQHAAFLRCVETTHLSPPRQVSKTKAPPPRDPKAWESRRFKVPPDFLATAAAGGPEPSASPRYERVTAQDVLSAAGVSFPEGASATYDPITSTLIVKNTVENLRLIESYTEELVKNGPKTLVLTAHLLDGPESLLRESLERSLTQTDHRGEMQRLFDSIATSKVTSLGTLRVESKGGTRATAKQTTEQTHVTEVGVNAEGIPRLTAPRRDVGLVIEVEPTIGPDGITAEINLDLHYDTAPPKEHREHLTDRSTGKPIEVPLTDFYTTHLQTSLTMLDGSARLIGLWPGKEQRLQALFITCDIVSAQ
jgi:phage baseplate assembly protein gpV